MANEGAGNGGNGEDLQALAAAMRGCRICVERPAGVPLPHEPNPIFRISSTARLCIASQAAGTRAHATTVPFNDPSGVRLRSWLGLTPDEFYDVAKVAIVPMGFCFPGQDAKGGDLPPRRECAPAWRSQVFAAMPQVELVLAIGQYAQSWHLGTRRGANLTETVGQMADALRRPRSSEGHPDAASLMAQQWLAAAQSLVRGGTPAARAGRGEAPDTLGTEFQLCGNLESCAQS